MSPKLALLICATSLIMAAPASAQNRDGDRPDRPRREEGGARPASAPTQAPPARTSSAPPPASAPSASGPGARYGTESRSWQAPASPAQRQAPPTSQPPAQAASGRSSGDRPDWSRGDRNGGDRSVSDRRGGDRGEADRRGGDRGWGDGGRWDRDERNRRSGGSWDRDERDRRGNSDRGWSYRGEDHARFRAPPYRYPYNWGYRSWRVGERLPYLFLSDGYYIDFEPYSLPRPPYGYRWVRFGPDVLLVNVYTGEIVDVVYDIFY